MNDESHITPEGLVHMPKEDMDESYATAMAIAHFVIEAIPNLISQRLGPPRDENDVRHISTITLCTAYLAHKAELAAREADENGVVLKNWKEMKDAFDEEEALPDKETIVREAGELLRCSPEEALWAVEAACVTSAEWADDTEREEALARMRGAFEELDTGQAEGPERGVDGPFDADEHGQPIRDVPETSPSVSPPSEDDSRCTNGPGTSAPEATTTFGDNLGFVKPSDGIACKHQFEPGVDGQGALIEPPYDVCIHCGVRVD